MFFYQNNKRNWNWRSHKHVFQLIRLLLGFTGTTRTPDIKYYCKRNFQLYLAKHRIVFIVFAQCLHMTLHEKFLYWSIRSDVWKLCSMDPWMCSLHCQWWRENRIRSDSVRSGYITAGYRIIWVEYETSQIRTFSSAQKMIIYSITFIRGLMHSNIQNLEVKIYVV